MKFDKLKKRAERDAGAQPSSVKTIDDLYNQTERQRAASEAPEQFKLFGGAVGGGKTYWLVNELIFHCLRYPGARALLARAYLSSLEKTTLLSLEQCLPMERVKKWSRTKHIIEFDNGSMLLYVGLGDDQRAIQKLLSMEISLWAIDQAEECSSERFFHMLNSRLRLKVPGLDKYRGLMTCNPNPGWLRQRFLENSFAGHRFIPSLPTDNPHLPTDYIDNLKRTLPPELVECWLQGRWDAISEENCLFDYEAIEAAMKRDASRGKPVIYAADIARFGADETCITKREGNRVTIEKAFSKKDTMQTVGEIVRLIGHDHAVEVRIDSIGVGAGVADRLREQGFNVVEIIGSAAPKHGKQYRNRRAEAYFTLKELLPALSLPDDDKLKAQMMAIRYRVLSDGLLLIESKDEIKRRGLPSPDRLDAVVMACSGEQRATLEEMERYLPVVFHPASRERIAEAAGVQLNTIPSLPPTKKIDHKEWLRRNGLTLEDEQDLIAAGIYIPGITRPPEKPKDEQVDLDADMRASGHSKIVR